MPTNDFLGFPRHFLSPNFRCFELAKTGSKIALLMPDRLEVRLGSQASGGFGSFGKFGFVWSFPKPPGPVPHSERLYSESSRSADRGDAQLPRWFCCGRGAERDDGRRSRRCFLYA